MPLWKLTEIINELDESMGVREGGKDGKYYVLNLYMWKAWNLFHFYR